MKTFTLIFCCMLSFQMLGQQSVVISGQTFQSEFKGRSLYVEFENKQPHPQC